MINQGVPVYNSLICLPSEDDLKKFNSEKIENVFKIEEKNLSEEKINFFNFMINRKTYKHKLSEDVQKDRIVKNRLFNIEYETLKKLQENENYSSDILSSDYCIKLKKSTTRKIIGFVTCGTYSYFDTKGLAKGFILLEAYEEILKMKKIFNSQESIVLIRNPTSLIYNYAKLKLLNN